MSGPDVALRRVRALSARTHFVAGFGQVTFDHTSEREDLRFPLMPVGEIDKLAGWGWIADDAEIDNGAAPATVQPKATAKVKAEAPASPAPAGDEAPPA